MKCSLDSPHCIRREAGGERGCRRSLLAAFSSCPLSSWLLPQALNPKRRGKGRGVPCNPQPGRTQRFPTGQEINPVSGFQSPSHMALGCSLADFCPAEWRPSSFLTELLFPTLGFLVLHFCSEYPVGDTAYLKCPVWETPYLLEVGQRVRCLFSGPIQIVG